MQKLTILGIILNFVLFIIKLIGGLISGSIGLISDAINSFSDILTSIVIFFTVKISKIKSDINHKYGHYSAEPIGGFFVGVVAGILGLEIIKEGIIKLISRKEVTITNLAIYILTISIIIKTFMAIIFIIKGKKLKSQGIYACGIDSRNDIIISTLILIGVILTKYKLYFFDATMAIFVGIFIIYSAYKICKENLTFLMGGSPSKDIYNKIKKRISKIKKIKGFHDLKAHYFGNKIHVEIHIEIDQNMTIKESHKVSNQVQKKIESIEDVSKAFIHIDPT
jgi:cation diffusion facilitator family transporter